MTTQGFVASHAEGAKFERGLRSFYEYRDLGIRAATAGRVVHQPPEIRHRELGRSEDIEMLEVVLPAGFATEEVPSV